jgi:hypothetical protein
MSLTPPVRPPHEAAGEVALAPAELLLLWAMRAWANVRISGARPQTLLAEALGAKTSPRSAALFCAWMQAVEASARRRLQIHRVACAGVTADERSLLLACGLAPVALETGEGLLQPMLGDAEPAMGLARALNAAFAADGWLLPARFDCMLCEARPTNRTLH